MVGGPVVVIRLQRSGVGRWFGWGEGSRVQWWRRLGWGRGIWAQCWRRLGWGQGSRVAPRRGGCRQWGVSGSEGRCASDRVHGERRRAPRPSRRRSAVRPACRCGGRPARGASAVCSFRALGPASGACDVSGLAAVRRSPGGAFAPCFGVERCFQSAGPPPPETVGVALGVVVGVCVLVTLVYIGPVGGPAVIAEVRLRRHVLTTVVAMAVIFVGERMVLCAIEVNPHSTALASGHQVSRAFPDLSRRLRRYRHCASLRVSGSSRWIVSRAGRVVGREVKLVPVPFDQADAVAALTVQ